MNKLKSSIQFYFSFYFSILLFICGGTIFFGSIVFAEKANSAACDRLAIGSYKLLKESNLSSDHRFILSYDKEAMLKGDGINLDITNISTGSSIHFIAKAQLVFQGASDDLGQIFLQSAVGDHSEFYIYDKNGAQLRNFKLSWVEGEEEFLNGVRFDQKTKRWLIATNRRIVAFSNSQQNITSVFEIEKQQGTAVEWVNQFTNSEPFIFANEGKNILIFISKISSTGSSSSSVLVFDTKSLGLVRTILSAGQSAPLLVDSTHLVFPSGGDHFFEAANIITGSISHQKVELYQSDAKNRGPNIADILLGPNNTFGTISEKGIIRYYNGGLQQVSEISIPNYSRWAKIKVASDGRNLLLLDSDLETTFLFDLKQRQFIKLPLVFNFLLDRSGLSIFQNQIFAPLFNERTNKISLLNYQIESLCVRPLPVLKQLSDVVSLLKTQNMTALSMIDNSELRNSIRKYLDNGETVNNSEVNEFKRSLKLFIDSYLVIESVSDSKNSFFRIKNLLSAFKPMFSFYSVDEKESIIDSVAVNLAEKLNKKSEYSEISVTKIANIFVTNLKPIFNLSAQPKTDFMMIKDLARDPSGKTVRPIVIGSQPITGGNNKLPKISEAALEDHDGFYIKNDFAPQQLVENQIQPFTIDWVFNNQKWQATGQSEILSLRNLVNKEKSPRYNEYWADNTLKGMVLISPNLGDPRWLVRQYLSYFKDQGFSFGESEMIWSKNRSSIKDFIQGSYFFPKDAILTENAKEWISNLISEGSLDYLLKEAHSGGNNEVIFIGKINSVLKGLRELENGKKEIIYIVFPTEDSYSKSEKIPITNQEFGAWMREREDSKLKNQLMYINASCWSSSKAREELIAARSPLLAEIATAYSSLTFKNSLDNHLQVLLSSIRKGMSYTEIQKNLEGVKSLDGTKNPYILPTQGQYEEKIWKGLSSALDYSVEIEKH